MIVRIAPENLGGATYDFVELCGSDLAANCEVASHTREMEKDRTFAAAAFNSLSQALVAAAFQSPAVPDNLITKLLPLQGPITFCVNVNPISTLKDLRHNITALKFA